MKKLVLTLLLISILFVSAFTLCASAEKLSELPLTMLELNEAQSANTFFLTEFNINSILPDTNAENTTCINTHISGEFVEGSSINLAFHCYDPSENYLGAQYVTLNSGENGKLSVDFSISIPETTSRIEISAKEPYSWSHSFLYSKNVTVSSEDGRVMEITDLLLPVYEKVGWYSDVTMYALDGRSLVVRYFDVEAYSNVGWYTKEDYDYEIAMQKYAAEYSGKNYNNAMSILDSLIGQYAGTERGDGIIARRTALMDEWRKRINSPLGVIASSASGGKASISVRNVSYKNVKAFYLKFDCYNSSGRKLEQKYSQYYINNLSTAPCDITKVTWGGVPTGTTQVKNIRAVQVIFTDGTVWKSGE